MEVIEKNELATAFYDAVNKIIVFKTTSILANKNIDKIESLLKKALSMTKKNAVVGEIVDLTHLRGNFNNIIHFLTKEYYPRMAELGMKKAAYVLSNDYLSNTLVQKIMDQTQTVEVQSFGSLESAKKWVIKQ